MYDTIIIGIVVTPSQIKLYIEALYRKKTKASYEKHFVLNDTYSDDLLIDYIKQYVEDSPYCYIALLDNSFEQGAIPTCNKHEMDLYKELSTSIYHCMDQKWAVYTSKLDLKEQQKLLGEEIGIDFIFSPFAIIQHYFHDKIQESMALYLLIKEGALSIAVFAKGELLYGNYVDTTLHEKEDELTQETLDEEASDAVDLESIDLDEVDVDLDESFDEMDDLENIENLDDIEELSENEEDLEKQLEENLEEIASDEEKEQINDEALEVQNRSTEAYKIFLEVQKSLHEFYHDQKYKSDFIENIYVADNIAVGKDLKRYLQEEMFLNVYTRTIELEMEVVMLAKEELGLS